MNSSQFHSLDARPWKIAFTLILWVAWLAVILVADFMAFMMFAFADSPGSASAAKLMIGPVLLWFGITFVAGVVLLILKRVWQVLLAFILAASPPFLVFAGYNLLSGARPVTPPTNTTVLTPPPPSMNVPARGFRPPATSQPDFQSQINKWTGHAATQPSK